MNNLNDSQIAAIAGALNAMKDIDGIEQRDEDYKIELIFNTIIDVLIDIDPIANKKIESIKELKAAMKYALSAIPFGTFVILFKNDHEAIKETQVEGNDPTMVKHVLNYLEVTNNRLFSNPESREAVAKDLEALRSKIID